MNLAARTTLELHLALPGGVEVLKFQSNCLSLEFIGGKLEGAIQKETDDVVAKLWISFNEHPVLRL